MCVQRNYGKCCCAQIYAASELVRLHAQFPFHICLSLPCIVSVRPFFLFSCRVAFAATWPQRQQERDGVLRELVGPSQAHFTHRIARNRRRAAIQPLFLSDQTHSSEHLSSLRELLATPKPQHLSLAATVLQTIRCILACSSCSAWPRCRWPRLLPPTPTSRCSSPR